MTFIIENAQKICVILDYTNRVFSIFEAGHEAYQTYHDPKLSTNQKTAIIVTQVLFGAAQCTELGTLVANKDVHLKLAIIGITGITDILRMGTKGYIRGDDLYELTIKTCATAVYRFGNAAPHLKEYLNVDSKLVELIDNGTDLLMLSVRISPYVKAWLKKGKKLEKKGVEDKKLTDENTGELHTLEKDEEWEAVIKAFEDITKLDYIPDIVFKTNRYFFSTRAQCTLTGKPIRWAIHEEGCTDIFYEEKSLQIYFKQNPSTRPKGWKGDLATDRIIKATLLQKEIDDHLLEAQAELVFNKN